MPSQLDLAWPRIVAELRRTVTDTTYAIWLEPLRPVDLDGGELVVSAPDELRSWIAERFAPLLERCATGALGEPVRVRVVAPGAPAARPAATPPPSPGPGVPTAPPDALFNPKLTFDQFVIGDSNRFAHAAALAVAEMPGQAYNPLFLHGPPGLGKTHLLHSIGNYVTEFGAGMSVRYATAESFTSEFVAAVRGDRGESFRARFRHNDLLLVDDVQFLADKARTEEEFFHTFNALHDTGAQLVLSADRLPRDLDALEDRLRERFEAGLVADLRPPDRATRLAVLRKRAHHDGLELAEPAALEAIAERITDNVRALEGALIRVVAFASLTGREITSALATEVLDGLYPQAPAARRSVADVQRAACEALGVSLDELLSSTRTARVSWARQVAMYLARELTEESLPAIGRAFGGRDHTSVLYAWRRTGERIADDRQAYEVVRELTERLRPSR